MNRKSALYAMLLLGALLRREDISQEDLQKISDLVSQRTT